MAAEHGRAAKAKPRANPKPWGIRKKNLAKLSSYMEDDFVTVAPPNFTMFQ
jgi:hypothetical protein